MSKQYNSVRFSEAPFYKPGQIVTIGGAGGIGSWLCLYLARLECKMYIYEYDTIDETNMGGQLFGVSHIGLNKAEGVKKIAELFTGESSNITCLGKFEEDSIVTDVCFSAFDNMAARKAMFNKWKSLENRKLFVDGRMLMQSGQVYVVMPGREEMYESTLFDDSDVEDQPCSAKATSHSGGFIAALMTAALTNHITAENDFPLISPFKTVYDFPIFEFLTYEEI
jgi:molybdopterin/thiamine biosynthesis adenylyltransferase